MQEVKNSLAASGLRDRKRAQTHARIQDVALDLFLNQGFENTTLDQIAEAADVSRRTLFHYFTSKDDMVVSAKADLLALIEPAISERDSTEPLMEMAENALVEVARHFQSPRAKVIARLIHDTPALKAWDAGKQDHLETALGNALARRKGLAPDDEAVRMTAMAAGAILRFTTERWLASQDERGPDVIGKAAFKILRQLASE